MTVVLLILKIVGILLLSLLGLLLLLIGILLFCPLRYQGKIEYQDELAAEGKLTFLLRLFQFSVQKHSDGLRISCRIFGFRKVLKGPEKETTEEQDAGGAENVNLPEEKTMQKAETDTEQSADDDFSEEEDEEAEKEAEA